MTSAEMLFPYDQSRADLLFARRRKPRPRQAPSRPRPEITPPQPPDKGRFRLTRGHIIIGGTVIAGGAIAAFLKPWEWFSQVADKSFELEKLGQELREWKLQDGRRMSDFFTEVQLTADLLQGNLDPKTILPSFKGPITLSIDPQVGIGGLQIVENLDRNDPRKVEIYSGNQLLYQDNWLRSSIVKLQVAPHIYSSPARFYIVVKELTQLLYRKQYQDLYRSLLESGPTRIRLNNPTSLPTHGEETTSSFGTTLARFEIDRYGYSSLNDFIDVGSRLQTAPIGATLRLDLEKRGQSVANLYWSQVEQLDTDFLKARYLVREQNGIVNWVNPFIVDENFFLLFAEYVRPLRRVLILP